MQILTTLDNYFTVQPLSAIYSIVLQKMKSWNTEDIILKAGKQESN